MCPWKIEFRSSNAWIFGPRKGYECCVYLWNTYLECVLIIFVLATAEVLYEECDGTEFELSGNVLDLRYIPDDMEFDQEPHSIATELPASGMYQAPE